MYSFLHLGALRIAGSAMVFVAACLVATVTYSQSPTESRSLSGGTSRFSVVAPELPRQWAPYDVAGDTTLSRDLGFHQATPSSNGARPAVRALTSPVAKFVKSVTRPITFSLVNAEPGTLLKSAIKVLHMLGIILGLGAATVLDLISVKFLVSGKIKADQIAIVKYMTGIVSAGLAILWVSGILYLTHYAVFDPGKLWNEKVWAKIAIVGVLTINGYFIHHTVLPLLEMQVGRSLFAGLSRKQIALLLVFGTVSATSWYVPLVLGSVPAFNFVVSAPDLLLAYSAILLLAIAATSGMASALRRGANGSEPTLQPAT
ncbi:MAG TPA: hypothetical protein VIT00_00920 [Terrimicrobiaceae bacterium]